MEFSHATFATGGLSRHYDREGDMRKSNLVSPFSIHIFGALALLATILTTILAGISTASAQHYASIVVDADTGRVLHEKNADKRYHPASLTKMMTLYMVFDALEEGRIDLDTKIQFSRKAARSECVCLHVGRGKSIPLETAILALAVKSANDVAVAVAEHMGGSVKGFAKQMTARARAIGMSKTTFRNASGLEHWRQLSTARDMATLGIRLQTDFPQYYDYFSRTHFMFRGKRHKTHNNLLSQFEGTDGIKTGYIRRARFNLVSSVTRPEGRLVGVVLGGAKARIRDRIMKRLLTEGYEKLEAINARRHLVAEGPGRAMGARLEAALAKNPFVNEIPQGDADGAMAGIEPKGNWIIQVGAFGSRERARKAAQIAVSKLGGLSDGTGILVVPSKSKKLYRARLDGLDKKGAYKACKVLKKARIDCLEIQPRRAG